MPLSHTQPFSLTKQTWAGITTSPDMVLLLVADFQWLLAGQVLYAIA